MRILIFGAAGDMGSRIVAEALSRGHEVTAIVRNPDQFSKLPTGVRAVSGDAGDVDDVVRLTTGQDIAISAIRPPSGKEADLVSITNAILDGVARNGIRVLICGGAASLRMPGQGDTSVLTAPGFLPESVVPIARACFAQYEACWSNIGANWTYLSPPAMLRPGIRTGIFRLGTDELLVDDQGNSEISMEDFAVAFLDEAESRKHIRTRFTAAY